MDTRTYLPTCSAASREGIILFFDLAWPLVIVVLLSLEEHVFVVVVFFTSKKHLLCTYYV